MKPSRSLLRVHLTQRTLLSQELSRNSWLTKSDLNKTDSKNSNTSLNLKRNNLNNNSSQLWARAARKYWRRNSKSNQLQMLFMNVCTLLIKKKLKLKPRQYWIHQKKTRHSNQKSTRSQRTSREKLKLKKCSWLMLREGKKDSNKSRMKRLKLKVTLMTKRSNNSLKTLKNLFTRNSHKISLRPWLT